jgi:DNA-binding LacI/PurR family transcriptional regulator
MRPSTRDRIQKAIVQLDYSPNQAARQLKTGHSSIIGLIVPSVANPFFGLFARHVEEAALNHGYQVLLGNSDRDPKREYNYAEELLRSGVRGIIFGTSLGHYRHLDDLIAKGMHIIAFDHSKEPDLAGPIDCIGVDNVQATRLLTKHILALGHRRIGFVSGPISTVSRKDRLLGYRQSLEEAKLEYDSRFVWEGVSDHFGDTSTIKLGRQGAHDLLSLPDRPTAIIAINDMYAFGVYAGARDLGISIPDGVSVAGIDNLPLTEIVVPALTTVQQPIKEIALLAVKRLIDRIGGREEVAPAHQILPPEMIVRESTAPVYLTTGENYES